MTFRQKVLKLAKSFKAAVTVDKTEKRHNATNKKMKIGIASLTTYLCIRRTYENFSRIGI